MTDFSGYLTITKRQDHQALNGNLAVLSSTQAVTRSWRRGCRRSFAVSLQGIESADLLAPKRVAGVFSRRMEQRRASGVNASGNKPLDRAKAPGWGEDSGQVQRDSGMVLGVDGRQRMASEVAAGRALPVSLQARQGAEERRHGVTS